MTGEVDLRAAVEGLRSYNNRGSIPINYYEDCERLAKAYLAEHFKPDETGPPIGWTIIKWDDDGILCESLHGHRRRYQVAPMVTLAKFRLCRELLETGVDAWESCQVQAVGGMRPYLSSAWHDKAKGALGDE